MPRQNFTWTGGYVGVHAGGIFSDSSGTRTTGTPVFLTFTPNFTPGTLDTSKNGFIGGAQAGYNLQSGALIVGAEADLSYADQKRTRSFTGAVTPLATALTTSATIDLKYFGTLRGRIGFSPIDQFMIYATGGLAFGEVQTSGSVVAVAAPTLRWDGKTEKVKSGWVLGAGAEYALTQNITLRGEYLYYDLGDITANATGNPAVRAVAALNGVDYVNKTSIVGSIGRVAANYKF